MTVDFHPASRALLPNALLIIAALDALRRHVGPSPKTDEVGASLKKNAGWVRRHGAPLDLHLATLSTNGHCFLGEEGLRVARALREGVPSAPPPARCGWCGSLPAGPVLAGRQLYACGRVMQWCPDHIPGLPKAEVPKRSAKFQHSGTWLRASGCCKHFHRHPSAFDHDATHVVATSDGQEIRPGALVSANHGSGFHDLYGRVVGTVVAVAAGTVLVDWPQVAFERWDGPHVVPAVRSDIVDARHLITPGAPDETGLSDYQAKLWGAIKANRVLLEVNADGTWGGNLGRRKIVPRSLEVLMEHRLLEPPPVPAHFQMSRLQQELRQMVYLGWVKVERSADGQYSAVMDGRTVRHEAIDELVRNGLLPEPRQGYAGNVAPAGTREEEADEFAEEAA